MLHFYIIDRARRLHLSEGGDKGDAIEKYNDTHKMKSDHAMPAIPCVHPNRFLPPELPDWMDVQLTIGNQICYKCASETSQESVIIEDTFSENSFYQSKNEL